MSYIPAGMGSKDSGAYAANCDATGYDSASVVLGSSPPRSRIAASGARNFMLSSSAENNHNQHDLDDSYAIDSYSIQPLKSDIIQSSALYGNLGNTSETISNIGTHAVSSASTGGETSGGRRGRRHPLSSSASSSVLADLDFDIPGSSLDTDRISSGAVGTKGSSKDGPTPAEVRKRQLELEVKRLELELLGKEASNSTAVIDSAGNTEFSNNSHSTKAGKGTWAESNSISAPTVGKITTDDKSRQALEEALAVMQMQNKMLAKRIEENEKEAQRSLEEEVERRTRAALAAAERKAESEKKDLLELERGKRLLMISQIEDEAAAKLMREQEDKELLEQERLKLEAKLKMMELAEKRHEEELREELSRREQEQRTRDLEREQRERDLRVELEENKRRLMEEIVSSEQEKAKANMQAQIELLEQQYQASLQSQRDRMAQEHEVQEHQARLKLEEETSRVRSELTSHYERENARLLQLQEESQRELEKEREEMRAAHKRMEQEKERLLHHMRQTEEKAREELVLAELTKSEYVSCRVFARVRAYSQSSLTSLPSCTFSTHTLLFSIFTANTITDMFLICSAWKKNRRACRQR